MKGKVNQSRLQHCRRVGGFHSGAERYFNKQGQKKGGEHPPRWRNRMKNKRAPNLRQVISKKEAARGGKASRHVGCKREKRKEKRKIAFQPTGGGGRVEAARARMRKVLRLGSREYQDYPRFASVLKKKKKRGLESLQREGPCLFSPLFSRAVKGGRRSGRRGGGKSFSTRIKFVHLERKKERQILPSFFSLLY